MATHVLDLLLQLPHRPSRRSLEDHVLQEVRSSIGLVGLESAAGVNPDAGGGGGGRERGLRRDTEAVRKRRNAGFWGGEDLGVVDDGGMGGGETEEAGVGVVEALDLGSDGLRESVVDHDGRGGGDGDGIGGEGEGGARCWSGRREAARAAREIQ